MVSSWLSCTGSTKSLFWFCDSFRTTYGSHPGWSRKLFRRFPCFPFRTAKHAESAKILLVVLRDLALFVVRPFGNKIASRNERRRASAGHLSSPRHSLPKLAPFSVISSQSSAFSD